MQVKFKKLSEKAKKPSFGTEFAAGADLYSAEESDVTIHSGQTCFIDTGIATEIPAGFVGLVFARSGLACKNGLRPANCVGVIDSDYRGSIKVALHNDSEYIRFVKSGDKIAQMVILPYPQIEFEEVEELEDTKRGDGGFGSTGR